MIDDDDLPSDSDQPGDDDAAPLLPTEQPTVDAANRRSVRKRARKADADQKDADQFWRSCLATPVGRREMWRLLETAHTFEERFACGPNGFPQPEATWFHAGEQALGQRLYQSWLRIDPLAVVEMHNEHDPRFFRRNSAKREA